MSELSPKARALLEAARSNHGPRDEDRERVLSNLHASLGIAAAIPTLVSASSVQASASGPQLVPPAPPSLPPPPPVLPELLVQPAATKALGWSKLLAWKAGKIYLASLVIGGSAVGVSMLPRGDASEVVARRSTMVVAPVEQPEPARAEQPAPNEEPAVVGEPAAARAPESSVQVPVAAESAPQTEQAEAPAAEQVALLPRQRPTERAKGSRAHVRHGSHANHIGREGRLARRVRASRELLAQVSEPSTAPSRSAQPEPKPFVPAEDTAASIGVGVPSSPELSLIRAALTGLRDGDPQQALRLLDEHAARYPNGAFGTERRGLHVVALCAAGRMDEGARERAQFLKKAGDSPIAARVRSACPR